VFGSYGKCFFFIRQYTYIVNTLQCENVKKNYTGKSFNKDSSNHLLLMPSLTSVLYSNHSIDMHQVA